MSIDYEKEIAEAVNAANDALYHLCNADEILNKAKNWGIADIMGGGLIITAIKRKRMQEAADEIETAKRALRTLSNELTDLNGYFTLNAEIDDFLSIADFVFDGFLTDMLSQSRINRAREQVKDAIAEVEGILDALSDIQAEY